MSITTKTGDHGMTSLYTGERIAKNSLRVDAYGTIDELNSALALARATSGKESIKETTLKLQKLNMALMADLASLNASNRIANEEISQVETIINQLEEKLPPLTQFITPGKTLPGSFFDLARTTARRAERNILTLASEEKINDNIRIYINRLSDLCFLLMRAEEELK